MRREERKGKNSEKKGSYDLLTVSMQETGQTKLSRGLEKTWVCIERKQHLV